MESVRQVDPHSEHPLSATLRQGEPEGVLKQMAILRGPATVPDHPTGVDARLVSLMASRKEWARRPPTVGEQVIVDTVNSGSDAQVKGERSVGPVGNSIWQPRLAVDANTYTCVPWYLGTCPGDSGECQCWREIRGQPRALTTDIHRLKSTNCRGC